MSLVGIIANPASGTDIRRLVAYGSIFNNQEKVRIVRRILLGLEASGPAFEILLPVGNAAFVSRPALAPLIYMRSLELSLERRLLPE